VRLAGGYGGGTATKKVLQPAMAAAWCNAAPKKFGTGEFEAGVGSDGRAGAPPGGYRLTWCVRF